MLFAAIFLTLPLTEMYAKVGSAIVCDCLRLYGNNSLCDRLRSAIRDPRSSAIVCDRLRSYGNQLLTSSDTLELTVGCNKPPCRHESDPAATWCTRRGGLDPGLLKKMPQRRENLLDSFYTELNHSKLRTFCSKFSRLV